MRISDNFLITSIDQFNYAIPCGQSIVDGNQIIILNDIAYIICDCINREMSESQIISFVCNKYSLGEEFRELIGKDVSAFINEAIKVGILVA